MHLSLPHITAILERTPPTLNSLLRAHSPDWTHHNYGANTWSAYQVVGHLISVEANDWIPRARIILHHGPARTFDPVQQTAAISPSSGRTLDDLLDEFAARRAQSLADLRSFNLTDTDLTRRGRHPALGEVTLAQLLATWAVHDLHHLRQIALAMAYQAREHVGPWRAYLNTLPPLPPAD